MIFKYIKQSNDVWMLADFENLNFSLVKLKVFWIHLLLLKDFDGDFLPGFLVKSKFDSSKFAFSYGFLDFIVTQNILIANCLLKNIDPVSMAGLV